MKNFINLSFIALILLCSCKSNSFMTQRYTKLGHSHKSVVVPKVAKQEKASPVFIQPVNKISTVSDTVILSASAIEAAPLSKSNTKNFFPRKVLVPLIQAGKSTYTQLSSELKKDDQQNLNSKKTFKEKLQRAAGLFDTLFKIVLWCIILAVLVAIIIIIILT